MQFILNTISHLAWAPDHVPFEWRYETEAAQAHALPTANLAVGLGVPVLITLLVHFVQRRRAPKGNERP